MRSNVFPAMTLKFGDPSARLMPCDSDNSEGGLLIAVGFDETLSS